MRSGTKWVMCVMGLVASQAFAVELVYKVEPGTKLEGTTKMEAEFVLRGDIPGCDKIDGGRNGSLKIGFELIEISDAAKGKITGTREIACTRNEMPMEPASVAVGPGVRVTAPAGEIV